MSHQPVAFVTGAGRQRVGWHVAQALAERGHAIALHYHTSAADAAKSVADFKQRGIRAQAFGADLTDEQAVRTMVADVLATFGRIDVLVNCAAIWRRKRLEDVTAQDVRAHFETNTLGTFLCTQHVGLAMTRQAEGGVVVCCGDWAEARPYVDYAAYFPSKGAIPALTRCMAVELGSRNPRVRVNCVQLGPVMLPPEMSAQEREEVVRATLVRREGSPRHVAQAVLHFIDNDFLTGVCLPVDGGRSIFSTDSLS